MNLQRYPLLSILIVHTLFRLTRAEMPCPTPVQLKKNVLLMTLIEMNGKPAPCLKNIAWEDESAVLDAFEQVKKVSIYSDYCNFTFSRLLSECLLTVNWCTEI